MNITTIGLDIAKNVVQVHGVNGYGTIVIRKKLSRSKMLGYLANLSQCWPLETKSAGCSELDAELFFRANVAYALKSRCDLTVEVLPPS